ncbi:hypothetical protein EYF80_045845 [Liparis tanakae]|uniref:Uncharacterized protein n=1 Tax=Liparis tanakae TaxID=230148 RepID=A0A4Z2FSW1_9TELE|nr:hypothetical protein EYF80_045845 [Liparis tanakae]
MCTSRGEYLVSRRNGVMLHFADRLAVTPLGADTTWCKFSSSSESTITFLIASDQHHSAHSQSERRDPPRMTPEDPSRQSEPWRISEDVRPSPK